MKSACYILLVFLRGVMLLLSHGSAAQQLPADLVQKPWKAQWITGPGRPINRFTASQDLTLKEYGVYKFRKTLELTGKPTSFVMHVSADNRYKLFVNEQPVAQGPARGDLYFCNFETIDLAPYLKAGRNTIAAVVWNDGRAKPEAQISYLTEFILQGNTPAQEVLNTNDSWKTIRDQSYQPLVVWVPGYYVAGTGELVDMTTHVKGWSKADYDDSQWVKARSIGIGPGTPKTAAVNSTGWILVPSPIPAMEMTTKQLASTPKATSVNVPAGFPATQTKVTVPANKTATILLDQGFLTNAYPTLYFSGGGMPAYPLGIRKGFTSEGMKT